MADIDACDEKTRLTLYGAYVPKLQVDIIAGWPSRSSRYRRPPDLHFDSREHAAAMTLAAHARHTMAYRYGEVTAQTTLLDVWCLGPARHDQAYFASLFAGEARDTDLRLFLHSQSAHLRLNPSGLYRPPSQIRLKKAPFAELRKTAKPLLEVALNAYQRNEDAVISLIDALGHPYCRGRWNPLAKTSTGEPTNKLPSWLQMKLRASGWDP